MDALGETAGGPQGGAEAGSPPSALPGAPEWAASATDARLVSGLLVVVAVTVLILARWLPPSPTGYGTHQRLLLPPCLLHALTGIPCPFCGMTTAFAHMARGEVREAFRCHVLGPALYLLTWLVGLAGLAGLLWGRWPLPGWVLSSRFLRWAGLLLLAAWAVQIWGYVR